MTTDTHALTIDMLRFSALLNAMNVTGLDRNYADKAMGLQSDSSDQSVEEVRDWVRLTLKGGSISPTPRAPTRGSQPQPVLVEVRVLEVGQGQRIQ
jgi:hypothetical protein